MDEIYIVEHELVDTYGGDFTYRDIWYQIIDNEIIFFERYYGAKQSDVEQITDTETIKELMLLIDGKV